MGGKAEIAELDEVQSDSYEYKRNSERLKNSIVASPS